MCKGYSRVRLGQELYSKQLTVRLTQLVWKKKRWRLPFEFFALQAALGLRDSMEAPWGELIWPFRFWAFIPDLTPRTL